MGNLTWQEERGPGRGKGGWAGGSMPSDGEARLDSVDFRHRHWGPQSTGEQGRGLRLIMMEIS